ncbi:MAG: ABC transporter substrate-binding protein [Oligoflexus sp.]
MGNLARQITKGVKGVILLLAMIGSVACTPKHKHEPRNHLIISTEPTASWIRNFNPLSTAGNPRWASLATIYEPLMIYNRMEGEYIPWLATGVQWVGDDHQQLEINLRAGVQWSDGTEFTAEDVAFTFNLLKQFPALDANGVWSFTKSIDVLNPTTLRFHFQKAFAPGLLYIAHQAIVAKHVWQDVKDPVSFANPNPVGTGPYTELTLFESQSYELSRNPYYWQKDKAKIPAIRFPALASNEQVMLNLLKGNIDLAGNFVPAVDRVFVEKDPDHHEYWFPLVGNMVFLYLNTTKPPYDQVAVRKALSRALDRPKIVKVAMFNYTEPGHPSGLTQAFEKWRLPAEHPEGTWTQFQPDQANQELDAAGFSKGSDGYRRLADGSRWQIDITVVNGWSDWVRAGQIIATNLREIGIDAQLRTYDFGAWFSQLQRGEFDAAISWSTDTVETYDFYRWLMSSSTKLDVGEPANGNWHRFSHPDADAALQALATSFDEDEQMTLVKNLQLVFMREAPAIPLFPNPAWGLANTRHFTNYPGRDRPYAVLSPNFRPEILQVLTQLEKRSDLPKKL